MSILTELICFPLSGWNLKDGRSVPAECAINVFKTTLNEFKTTLNEFKNRGLQVSSIWKTKPTKICETLGYREMHNLMR